MEARSRSYHEAAFRASEGLRSYADVIPPEDELEQVRSWTGPDGRVEDDDGVRQQAQLAVLAFESGVAVSADLFVGGFDTHAVHDPYQGWLLGALTDAPTRRTSHSSGRPWQFARRWNAGRAPMNPVTTPVRLLLWVCLLGSPPSLHAAETGEQIAERECAACHGHRGRSETTDIPSIGGFSEFAIMDLLDSYRLGFRQARAVALEDGSETDMVQIVEALSEQAIEAVAIYYSEQEWVPHEQSFDADLARRAARIHSVKCGKCHPRGGSVPEADHAILAGQWREYLAGEFRDFDSGARRMADKMKKRYDTLSAADKDALLELYVSAGRY